MRRQIPLLITFVAGFVMIGQYFVPHTASEKLYEWFADWGLIIGLFASILGYLSIIRVHMNKIKRQVPGWGYSGVVFAGMVLMVAAGILTGIEEGGFFQNLYESVIVPITSTMFALLAFYIASAAYRAFRVRTTQATVLLVAAAIVMLGRIPIGTEISFWRHAFPQIPTITALANWILTVPNLAAKRAINLGVGLGIMAMSLKIILGIERTYLGEK